MNSLDKVIEYLHYHQGASRHELMDALHLGVKDTQMKRVHQFMAACTLMVVQIFDYLV